MRCTAEKPVTDDALDEVSENIQILIREEMEVQHRLGDHPTPVAECPVCRSHAGVPPAA